MKKTVLVLVAGVWCLLLGCASAPVRAGAGLSRAVVAVPAGAAVGTARTAVSVPTKASMGVAQAAVSVPVQVGEGAVTRTVAIPERAVNRAVDRAVDKGIDVGAQTVGACAQEAFKDGVLHDGERRTMMRCIEAMD